MKKGQIFARCAVVAIAGILQPLPAAAECFSWPVESVYDGDTLRATVGGQSTRIRIMGLDTPELPPHNKCASEKELGYAARDRLRALLEGAEVAFCPDGRDRYGRTLAVVLVDGRDVADVLIGEGLAREYNGGRRQGWCS
ncbi:MAG: thermonuclease family protein [Kiloniellaceae bacterium]